MGFLLHEMSCLCFGCKTCYKVFVTTCDYQQEQLQQASSNNVF